MEKYAPYLNNKIVKLILRAFFIYAAYFLTTHAGEFYRYLKG